MATKQETKDLPYFIDSCDADLSMTSRLALYSNNNTGLAVIFVEEDSFFSLLGAEDSRMGAKKYFEWVDFIHPEDSDLLSYPFLSQEKSEQITFNLRILKEDKSVVIAWVELEKISFSSTDKIITFNAKIYDAKGLFGQSVLESKFSINFSSLLRYSLDFLYFKNLHHIFTASSQTMANITGFSSGDEHIGLTDYDIFPKEHADIYYRLENEILQGKKASIVSIEPFYDENGNEGWVDTRKYPIKDESAKIVGLFGISRDITQELLTKIKLEETQEQLNKLANQDSLTLLFTRRHGYDLCQQAIAQATRYETPLSLIMFDVDHFKKFNDIYGHDCGDKVLVYIAETIRKIIRETDIAFRYGGEEFVICTPHTALSDAHNVMVRINSILNFLSSPCTGSPVTVSSGIAELVEGESLDGLLNRADLLMYKAKEAGRNCIKY